MLRRLWLLIALLCIPSASHAATVAFVGATVIDGTGRAPLPDAVIVVIDGRVAALGPRASTPVPSGAERVELSGKTIIPGLVNAHAHVRLKPGATAPPRTQLADQLALYARYGVTTVYGLADDGVEDKALRDELRRAPEQTRPLVARYYVAGLLEAPDAVQAKAAATAVAKAGFDFGKIRMQGPADATIRKPEIYRTLVGQARKETLSVAAHIQTLDEARAVVDAGVEVLAHSVRDRDIDPATIAAMKRGGVGYIPTLVREVAQYVYESTPDFVTDPFFAKEEAYRARLAELLTAERRAQYRLPPAQAGKTMLAQARRNLMIVRDAGIPVAMGGDTGSYVGRWQGYFEHLELELLVESGLTPMEALVAATSGGAKIMHIDDAVGSLQPGKFADLLVLGADPLTDIRNTKTLEQVWIGGRLVR